MNRIELDFARVRRAGHIPPESRPIRLHWAYDNLIGCLPENVGERLTQLDYVEWESYGTGALHEILSDVRGKLADDARADEAFIPIVRALRYCEEHDMWQEASALEEIASALRPEMRRILGEFEPQSAALKHAASTLSPELRSALFGWLI